MSHHFFVAEITYRPGKNAYKKRRHEVMEQLHDRIRRSLAPTLADWCGEPVADLKPQDIDLRLQCMSRASYDAPVLSIGLRLHETSTQQADLLPYSTALSMAFLQFVGSELKRMENPLAAVHVFEAGISTWLPFAIGVRMKIETGLFLRSWGGLFQISGRLQFDPV